jgi:uncharacterized protein YjbI with pentapeptide repeats
MKIRRSVEFTLVTSVLLLVMSSSFAMSQVTNNHLITGDSVGTIYLGMTIAEARKAMSGTEMTRGSNENEVYSISLTSDGKKVMTLFTDQGDLDATIDEDSRIDSIRVFDPRYKTGKGIHPGSKISAAETSYGKPQFGWDPEGGESLRFASQPKALGFYVSGKTRAGVYRMGNRLASEEDFADLSKGMQTSEYATAAEIHSISINGFSVTEFSKAEPSFLLTTDSAGDIRLGITVAEARKVFAGVRLEQNNVGGEGTAIEVRYDDTLIMILTTDQKDLSDYGKGVVPIDENAKIQSIKIWDSRYNYANGVFSDMSISEAEKRFGKVNEIVFHGLDESEHVTFSNQPRGASFTAVPGDSTAVNAKAGVYSDEAVTTTKYSAAAKIFTIKITNPDGTRDEHKSPQYLITADSAAGIKIGMTVGEARKAIEDADFSKSSDGDGDAKIKKIQVWHSSFKTAGGVHPKMKLIDAEKIYGKPKVIFMQELEAREFVKFINQPKGLDFRLSAPNGEAGVYPKDALPDNEYYKKTTEAAPDAYLLSIGLAASPQKTCKTFAEFKEEGNKFSEDITGLSEAEKKKREKDAMQQAIAERNCWVERAKNGEKELTGAYLFDADLTSISLRSVNLKGALLARAKLISVDFTGSNLTEVEFAEADLTNANFTNADLAKAKFTGANLTGSDLTKAKLTGARVTTFQTKGVDFDKWKERGGIVETGSCRGLDSEAQKDCWGQKVKQGETNLRGASLRSSDLSGAQLTKVDLSYASLYKANLSGADLSGAVLVGAYLTEADLAKANLKGAVLTGAHVSDAKLNGADLTGAKLDRADLTGADLTGADLTGADLENAILTRARVSNKTTKGVDFEKWEERSGIIAEEDCLRMDYPAKTKCLVNKWVKKIVKGEKDLKWASLTGASLTGLDMSGAVLSGVNLSDADLSKTNLTGADLNGARLLKANLSEANLTRANLSNADLLRANLTGADLTGTNLTGVKLDNTEMTNAILTGADLSNANLFGESFVGANLTSAKLSGATLTYAKLNGANLTDADLTKAKLGFGKLSNARLTRANLTGADLSRAEMDGADLTGAVLTSVIFTSVDLRRRNFSGANMKEANLSEADLTRANLSDADLTKANLTKAKFYFGKLNNANLTSANLTGAGLGGTNLTGSNLTGTNLTAADLSGTDLSKANFTDAIFSNVNLSEADLTGTDLTGADLSKSRLTGANLTGTNLTGANLTGTDLSKANLTNAILSNVKLTEADLTGANLTIVDLTGVNLTDAKLTGARVSIFGTKGVDFEKWKGLGAIVEVGDCESLAGLSYRCWKKKIQDGEKNLKRAKLNDIDLTNAKLAGVDLTGTNLMRTKLTGADLTGTNLTDAVLNWADLSEAKLTGANLTRASLYTAKLAAADLTGAGLTSARMESADLTGANLTNADLSKARLIGANFTGADLTGVKVKLTDFRDTDLTKAKLAGVNLRPFVFFSYSPKMHQADLTNAKLAGVRWTSPDLSEANLTGADLTGAVFATGSDLTKANLTKANMSRANFSGADLTGATLTDAILTGATVSRSTTKGIDFEDWKKRGGIVVD